MFRMLLVLILVSCNLRCVEAMSDEEYLAQSLHDFTKALRATVPVWNPLAFTRNLTALRDQHAALKNRTKKEPVSPTEEKDSDDMAQYFQPKLEHDIETCLLYTSPSPRDRTRSRMPSSA